MSQRKIRILLVDAERDSLDELKKLLQGNSRPGFDINRIDMLSVANPMLSSGLSDVIIYCPSAPIEEGLQAVQRFCESSNFIPIIVFAADGNEKIAVKAIQSGAQDYLIRRQCSGEMLARSVRYAIERHNLLAELKFALASEKVLMEELDKKNKELVELSITDGLTGLYNHRFIQERCEFEFKRAQRYNTPLSSMILDIDHFKSINDKYGHQFGDQVLMQIGSILLSLSREVDMCGRYGGEEFMIITNLSADDAMKYATKLHASIDKHEFRSGQITVHVTVSIGIAEYRSDMRNRQELIQRADTALYWAKRDGRNLIRLWKEVEGGGGEALDQYGIEGLKSAFIDLSSRMRATYMESTNALVRAIDAKDHYTQEHSNNVARYAVGLAVAIGLQDSDIVMIQYAGLLHDIGKIGVPQEILVKRDALTTEEFNLLRKHPVIGANILKDVTFLEREVPVVLHHHEHFDGNGYPQGLKGREIPLGARILAVADAFDAMTTDREYRKKLSDEEALEELHKGSGKQFAPELVEAFIAVMKKKGRKSFTTLK